MLSACGGSEDATGPSAPPKFVFDSVTVGWYYSCGLSQGAAYCWGSNAFAKLGDGTSTGRNRPAPVAGGIRFTSLSAGASHACGLTASGEAFCWGRNEDGEVGSGPLAGGGAATVPSRVSGGIAFTVLKAGEGHTCALDATGAGYCWGLNEYGQLGDGTKAPRLTPTPVGGGLRFVALSAGGMHTCGLTASGAAYCWGNNENGQLGNGTDWTSGGSASILTPTAVLGGLEFVMVAAGNRHSCGLTRNGAVYCWGYNYSGQLGDRTLTSANRPQIVSRVASVVHLSAGYNTTCAISSGGAASCWGGGPYLGDGSGDGLTIPTGQVVGVTFASIARSIDHACGVSLVGRAYCWGSNVSGEVGDGSNLTRFRPTAVLDPTSP